MNQSARWLWIGTTIPYIPLGEECGRSVAKIVQFQVSYFNCGMVPFDLSVYFLEDCQWSLWGEWEPCSKQCGGGSQKQTRAQSKATHGGKPCEGRSSQTRWCNKQICSSWLISMTTSLVVVAIILYLRWKAARKPARDIFALPNLNLKWPNSNESLHKAKCVRSDSILPIGWEEQTSADGNVVFIDHITRQTSHQHPRTGMPGNQFNGLYFNHLTNPFGVVFKGILSSLGALFNNFQCPFIELMLSTAQECSAT